MIAQRYRGTVEEDMLLAGWFYTLHQTGDWENCFIQPQGGIGWFYAYFQRDVQLWYVEENKRLILAGWFEPMTIRGAFFSVWVEQSQRLNPRMPQAVGELLAHELERASVILSLTKQEKLLDCFAKMGYTIVGQIPALWAGLPVWLLSLNATQLDGGTYARRQKSRHVRVASPATGGHHGTPHGPPPAKARAGPSH